MSDYFQIDVLDVKSESGTKSGDAIPLRYRLNGETYIHVVDGGYIDTGDEVVTHIKRYYDNATHLDNVVVTHPDGDHANGLRVVLESFTVGSLWMHRPWLYAEELLPRFVHFKSADNLRKRLREVYPNVVALEEIALRQNIPIRDPFQGATIGAFHVLAPTKGRYLDIVVNSTKTPDSVKEAAAFSAKDIFTRAIASVVRLVKAAWGEESLSPKETNPENEMSVVQYARLCDESIVLTGDAGQHALAEAADCASSVGLALPGVNRFQVPHHGSRRNVHSDLLDRWFGTTRESISGTWTAVISAAKKDTDHPKKAVVRGFIHRGANVLCTGDQGGTICMKTPNAPDRGWGGATILDYPSEQEAD